MYCETYPSLEGNTEEFNFNIPLLIMISCICIVTRWGIYDEPELGGNPEGKAPGIYWGLRLYFIVNPDLSHNADNLNYNSSIDLLEGSIFTVPCEVLGRGFFRLAGSFPYISRQGMTSLDLCLQLIPSGQGNQPWRRQPALAGLASPRDHRREAGGHWR